MKPADDYISDFIKDINRGRVLEVRSIMEKANRATGPKMGIKTPLEDALQQLVNAGKESGAIVADDGKTIGKISMVNAIAAMARPDRGDEVPKYKLVRKNWALMPFMTLLKRSCLQMDVMWQMPKRWLISSAAPNATGNIRMDCFVFLAM